MHGRVKVRTTAEQEELKKKERAKKVQLYKAGIASLFEKRQKGEQDESGLEISAKLLSGNPDIYTIWNIRREIVLNFKETRSGEEFDKLLEDELRLTEVCLKTQPKSYGTWHHRCWVLDHMTSPPWKTELALCNKYLEYDERNFHCWDYRRFIVARANVTAEEELRFTDEKIATNFSNYSAWHLRSNLLPQVYPDPTNCRPIHEDQHKLELELVTNAAFTDPFDQSAWFYQRWLLGRQTPQLRITHSLASRKLLCVAFNQSVSPKSSEITVAAFGDQSWQTVDGKVSSFVWKKYLLGVESVSEITAAPVELWLKGELRQSVSLSARESLVGYSEAGVFQSEFSPGVTEVLCNVLESCQSLLELEPNTKWPLLTSVLLMQAIDRKRFKEKSLEYLDLLAKIDKLRANYYMDLRSRYVMEQQLEEQYEREQFSLTDAGLTALYHSQYLLPARQVDLSANNLGRSLPRLATLQFCQVLNLDDNKLQTLKGFPSLPLLEVLSVRRNKLQCPGDVAPHITPCSALVVVHLDGNPLAMTHQFHRGTFIQHQ